MSSNWANLGDTVHALSLVNTLAFAYIVGFHRDSIFDPSWKQQGFCLVEEEDPTGDQNGFWSTHDLCFCANIILAAAHYSILKVLKDQPEMERATKLAGTHQLIGIVGHGIGHGALSATFRFIGDEMRMDQSPWESGIMGSTHVAILAILFPAFFVFWVMLLKAAMPAKSWSLLGVLGSVALCLQPFCPVNLSFTYVQSIAMSAVAWNEMTKPKEAKGFEYSMFPCLIALPLGLLAWVESTQCSSFIRDFGGHVLYDAFIPISMTVFYVVCWIRVSFTFRARIGNAAAPSLEKVKGA
ncbi:expressed unknown protein [Seminavis robusta]|uniref:Uncharacterized protein n=1 Tax=Seminavis robusta TaxID=568900 RepID=A0A9N8ECT9_9STRA|nr:expressed unknown protein [Seminavis robusta]|eukprot:Sro814_g206360.1 n/a (297) ;mRNA; r:29364-30254